MIFLMLILLTDEPFVEISFCKVKLKELIVDPGKGMSFQKHFKRSEIWLVSKGSCVVNYSKDDPDNRKDVQLNKFDHYFANSVACGVLAWSALRRPAENKKINK